MIYCTSKFNYDYRRGLFIAGANAIGFKMSTLPDGSSGIVLVSKKTSKPLLFKLDMVEQQDGDTMAWHLISLGDGILSNLAVLVYAD